MRIIVRMFGNETLHTYIHLAPLLSFFRDINIQKQCKIVLEVGCGSGINLFELMKLKVIEAVGFDIDKIKIEAAESIRQAFAYDKLTFRCEDALTV